MADKEIKHDITLLRKEISELIKVLAHNIDATDRVDKSFLRMGKSTRNTAKVFSGFSGEIKTASPLMELLDGNMWSFFQKLPRGMKLLGLTGLSFAGLKNQIKSLIQEGFQMSQQFSQMADGLTFLNSAGNSANLQWAAFSGSKGSLGQVTGALRALDTAGVKSASVLVDLSRDFATLEQATGVSADAFVKLGYAGMKYFNATTKEAKTMVSALVNMEFSSAQLQDTLEGASSSMEKLGSLTKMTARAGLEFVRSYASGVKTLNDFGVSTRVANEFMQKLTDPSNFQELPKLLGQLGVPLNGFYEALEGGEGAMEKYIENAIVGTSNLGKKLQGMPAMARFNIAKTLGIDPQILTKMAGQSAAQVRQTLKESKKAAEDEKLAQQKRDQAKANAERVETQFMLIKAKALGPIMSFVQANLSNYMQVASKVADIIANIYRLFVNKINPHMDGGFKFVMNILKKVEAVFATNSLEQAMLNLGEFIGKGLSYAIATLGPIFIKAGSGLVQSIVKGAGGFISALLDSFEKEMPAIINAISNGASDFLNILADKGPKVIGQVLGGLAEIIAKSIPTLVSVAAKTILQTFLKAGPWGKAFIAFTAIAVGTKLLVGSALATHKTLTGIAAMVAHIRAMRGASGGAGAAAFSGMDSLMGKSGGATSPGTKPQGRMGRFFSGGGGKLAGKIGGSILAVGTAAYGGYQLAEQYSDNEKAMQEGNISFIRGKENKKDIADTTVSLATGAIGGVAGAKMGAVIGTFIAPGIGTAVGAALGGMVGGLVGFVTPMFNLFNQKTEERIAMEEKIFGQRFKIMTIEEEKEKKLYEEKIKNNEKLTAYELQRHEVLKDKIKEIEAKPEDKAAMTRFDENYKQYLGIGAGFGKGGKHKIEWKDYQAIAKKMTGKDDQKTIEEVVEKISNDKRDLETFVKQELGKDKVDGKDTAILAKMGLQSAKKDVASFARLSTSEKLEKYKQSDEFKNAIEKNPGERVALENRKLMKLYQEESEKSRIGISESFGLYTQHQIDEMKFGLSSLAHEQDIGNALSKNIDAKAEDTLVVQKAQNALIEAQRALSEAEAKESGLWQKIWGSDEKAKKAAQDKVIKLEDEVKDVTKKTQDRMDQQRKEMTRNKGFYGAGQKYFENQNKKDDKPPTINLRTALIGGKVDMRGLSALG